MRCWRLGGRVEYRGIHFSSPISGPRFSTSRERRLQASSISCRETPKLIRDLCHICLKCTSTDISAL
jgi:hypothetical protein